MNDTEYPLAVGPSDLTDDERAWWLVLAKRLTRAPIPSELVMLRTLCSLRAIAGRLMTTTRRMKAGGKLHLELMRSVGEASSAAEVLEERLGIAV